MSPTLASQSQRPRPLTDPGDLEPELPKRRGPISAMLMNALESGRGEIDADFEAPLDPLCDDDLQLALYVSYELHYRGFGNVDADLEWHPGLLAFRRRCEQIFEHALHETFPAEQGEPASVPEAMKALAESNHGPSLSEYIGRKATLEQFKEFVIHRSAYQLKEADPHTWAIPRLWGKAKAALVEIQTDEYGGDQGERMHSVLFAKTMSALGLNCRYGFYLDQIPGVTLATVNLISMFGLHRRLRGAAIGHLALFEMTSSQPNRLYGDCLRRYGAKRDAIDFYDEHVEADSVHEVIAAYDLAGGLAGQEPDLIPDIRFGARACAGLDNRFSGHLLDCWERGVTSLRR